MNDSYAYGAFLAQLQHTLTKMMQEINRGFRETTAQLNSIPITRAEAIELRLMTLYEERIARERRIGLAYVKREVNRVRRELGLDEIKSLR